jgi:hypothetical protein
VPFSVPSVKRKGKSIKRNNWLMDLSSHYGECVKSSLLGCETKLSDRNLPMFCVNSCQGLLNIRER